MMRWWQPSDDSESDIDEARQLRAEAIARRAQLKAESDTFVQTIVRRRALDGFGEELQITFTRRAER